jgi:predicted nucleotidyltransferase
MILNDFRLQDEDVLNVYPFGSKIYKTDNHKSDWDFIVVVRNESIDRDLRKTS